MAANFLSSTISYLNGHKISEPRLTGFCSLNGFFTQMFVIQTDYWVLLVAVCTYLILAGNDRLSLWVQDHRAFLFVLPWLFSTLWAALGLGLVGYKDIGACMFPDSTLTL